MSKSIIKNVRIKGLSLITGENEKFIDNEPLYYNNDPKKLKALKEKTGINKRYTASENTTVSDLAEEAAKKLIEELKINKSEIDAVIFTTHTGDYLFPGCAHLIHKKLKLERETACFDFISGCSGFVYGFYTAALMINAGAKRILLLTGDTMSKLIHPEDKSSAVIFGDSGSAAIIEYDETAPETHFILKSDGQGFNIIYAPVGLCKSVNEDEIPEDACYKKPDDKTQYFYMNGIEVFSHTLFEQPELISEILEFANCNKEEIDYFILHQANKYILDNIIKKAKIPPEKTPVKAFSEFGNLNSASIPSVLCSELSDTFRNTKKKVLLHGFGTGLSWASCITELKNTVCLKPEKYKRS